MLDPAKHLKGKLLLCIYTIYVSGKLGKAGEHTLIRNTLKHLHLSSYNRAICTLKCCAGILIRQIESDIVR